MSMSQDPSLVHFNYCPPSNIIMFLYLPITLPSDLMRVQSPGTGPEEEIEILHIVVETVVAVVVVAVLVAEAGLDLEREGDTEMTGMMDIVEDGYVFPVFVVSFLDENLALYKHIHQLLLRLAIGCSH